jgi:RNA polymerase sigma-70 factor (ECF subfamily)
MKDEETEAHAGLIHILSASIGQRLYADYRAPLLAFLRSHAVSPEDAEDVLQDTFIKVMLVLSRGALPTTDHLRGWLWRVALNTLIDHLRLRRQRTVHVDIAPLAHTLASPPALDSTDGWLALETIRVALASMSPRHRANLLAYGADGRTLVVLAQAAGLPLNTINMRLVRARRAWEKAYAESQGETTC